jgi:hypothetical protein
MTTLGTVAVTTTFRSRIRMISAISFLVGVSTTVSIHAQANELTEFPAPNVLQLAVNEDALYDRLYQRVTNAVNIHSAPDAEVIDVIDAGFNFVTTQGTQGTWTMINPDQWVATESLRQVLPSTFSGVLLNEPLAYPMGWILQTTVPSRTPGAEPLDADLPLIRYQKISIFESIEVDEWRWYLVGADQWVHQTKIAKVLPVERTEAIETERWISVDLYEQVLIAYEGSVPVFATLISSGLEQWPTNEGVFRVYVRYPRAIMSGAYGQPDFYYLEEVPWTMYFDNDIGLHGTYWHDGFGYRHSHGCVNLSITDAEWLYAWSSSEIDLTVSADLGATVFVYSSGEYR